MLQYFKKTVYAIGVLRPINALRFFLITKQFPESYAPLTPMLSGGGAWHGGGNDIAADEPRMLREKRGGEVDASAALMSTGRRRPENFLR